MLAPLGVDLAELSGGSYEAPAMMGATRDERTLAREAYFLEFARDIAGVATMPLMVTGGIRRREVAEKVLDGDIAMVGIVTALAIEPDLPRRWRAGQPAASRLRPITSRSPPRRTWRPSSTSCSASDASGARRPASRRSGRWSSRRRGRGAAPAAIAAGCRRAPPGPAMRRTTPGTDGRPMLDLEVRFNVTVPAGDRPDRGPDREGAPHGG